MIGIRLFGFTASHRPVIGAVFDGVGADFAEWHAGFQEEGARLYVSWAARIGANDTSVQAIYKLPVKSVNFNFRATVHHDP